MTNWPLPRLLPGETIVGVKGVNLPTGSRNLPSGVHELQRLARTGTEGKIGDFGPVLASQSLEEETSAAPSLHRYEAIYGRDSLRVALDLLDIYPELAQNTLLTLAKLQGVSTDLASEEEPGRIVHEVRDPQRDPVAIAMTKEFGWAWPYYGSVDATVEFIRTLTAYCRRADGGLELLKRTYHDKAGAQKSMADALVAAVTWMMRRLASNSKGILEFKAARRGGLENQAWKDSWDAYFHHNGKIASHQEGIASIEVQRAAFDALTDAAEFYDKHLDRASEADDLIQAANRLRQAIMDKFWTDDKGGYFVLGTDRDEAGQPRQLKIRTSNMGHVLYSKTLLGGDQPEVVARREAVIKQLFSPEMLNVSGIRTLATDEYRFRPGAYHNGSVWLWDTHLIARGLELHGYFGLSLELRHRLENIIKVTQLYPEFVRGDDTPQPSINQQIVDVWDEKYQRLNHLEQPPQEIQAWSVSAVLAAKYQMGLPQEAVEPTKRVLEIKLLDDLKHKH